MTADVCHGLLDGTESRQQLYTLLSRGRHANHAWLQVNATDTHPAPVAHDLVNPSTATQMLESILDRDQAPLSATTLTTQADDPARLLGPAITCYLDAISYAAEQHLPPAVKNAIEIAGEKLGLTGCDAWPALRSHLLLIAANNHNPVETLHLAAGIGRLDTARDAAAVVDHRLDLTTANRRTRGPLPWLPGIPTQLLDNPAWKTYLAGRYTLTRQLATDTHQAALDSGDGLAWSRQLPKADSQLIADVELWRAAHSIPDNDLRPTGPPVFAAAERRAQFKIDQRVDEALDETGTWTEHLLAAAPRLAAERGLPLLVANLAGLASLGHDAHKLLHQALQQRPLPDHHPAEALNYRITELAERRKPPAAWERVEPPPRRPEEPPSMRPRPDRGIHI